LLKKEIKLRGPFLSLSEFFNRQLSSDPELARAGAVESALINIANGEGATNPYEIITSDFVDIASTIDANGEALVAQTFPQAAEGFTAYGFPGWARQADVLRPVSGILTARDDTFTIRAYGAKVDKQENVISQAWCEAVIQRKAEYVDSADEKDKLPNEAFTSEINETLGRRYEIIKFRWLNPDEV